MGHRSNPKLHQNFLLLLSNLNDEQDQQSLHAADQRAGNVEELETVDEEADEERRQQRAGDRRHQPAGKDRAEQGRDDDRQQHVAGPGGAARKIGDRQDAREPAAQAARQKGARDEGSDRQSRRARRIGKRADRIEAQAQRRILHDGGNDERTLQQENVFPFVGDTHGCQEEKEQERPLRERHTRRCRIERNGMKTAV